jgi:hypothetical protein
METKISLILGETYYSKAVSIPENQSSNEYFEETIDKILSVKEVELVFALLEVGDGTYLYGSKYFQHRFNDYIPCRSFQDLKTVSISPVFIEMHINNTPNDTKYLEIPLLLMYPEFVKCLQFNNGEKRKQFFKFLINDLNLNYHPDSPIEEYVNNNGIIINKDGKPINFGPLTIEFLNLKVDNLFNIMGDQIYDVAFEILQEKLREGGIPIGTEVNIGTQSDTIKKMASMYTGQQYTDNRTFPTNTINENPPLSDDEKEIKEFDWNHATKDQRESILFEAEPIFSFERLAEYSALDYEDLPVEVRMKIEKSARIPIVIKFFANEFGENIKIIERAGREMIIVYFDPTQEEPGGLMTQELMTNPELNLYLGDIDWTTNEISFHFDSNLNESKKGRKIFHC